MKSDLPLAELTTEKGHELGSKTVIRENRALNHPSSWVTHPHRSWKTATLLGIEFFADSFDKALEVIVNGGFIVFPSGPNLASDLWHDCSYRAALQSADIIFADSGAMVLLWKVLSGEKIPRYSGLRMLTAVLKHPIFHQEGQTFWVMPSRQQEAINLRWLRETAGLPISESDCYCAPLYGAGLLKDPQLLEILMIRRPRFVILCIGGGVQERLGLFLRKELGQDISILCTGAAIGFLSGVQAQIPKWMDATFLGWCFRCMMNPKIFVPRYFRAFRLIKILFLYWLYGRGPVAFSEHSECRRSSH